MEILNAVARAYQVAKERNWDTVYWCVDLHGTVLDANYSSESFSFIDEQVVKALQMISILPETRLILWSSINQDDEVKIRELFSANDIVVHYVNENPEVASTATGAFDRKFYFSILIDDKAGFTPETWPAVAHCATAHSVQLRTERGQE